MPRPRRQPAAPATDAPAVEQPTLPGDGMEAPKRCGRKPGSGKANKVAGAYHAWRGDKGAGAYADEPGFCKASQREEIAGHGFVLTPGRYVGAAAAEEDDEPFAEKFARLTAELERQFAEGARLEEGIRENLRGVGYTESRTGED